MVLASRLKQHAPHWECFSCHAVSADLSAAHVCSACGMPQPIRPEETPFSAFGFPVAFNLDEGVLQTRFYEISRRVHPDRFARDPARLQIALSRMGFLNTAFETLKDSESRTEWILKADGFLCGGPKGATTSFAEEWFDLQDALTELGVVEQRSKVAEFKKKVASHEFERVSQIVALQRKWDEASMVGQVEESRQILAELEGLYREGSTLRSLRADLQRLEKRQNSGESA